MSDVDTLMWPDSYQPQHVWDFGSMVHTEYSESGAVTASGTFTQADYDAWVSARSVALATAATNERTVEQALSDQLATLQALIDTPNATINAGPAPYIKDCARALRRLTRHALNRFDGAT